MTFKSIEKNFGRAHAFGRLAGSLLLNQVLMKRIASRTDQGHPQLAVYSQDLIGQAINVYGWWEHEQLALLRQFIVQTMGRGGAMLDVGANIGNHSVCLCDLFDEVHAVEANPRTYKLLEFNAAPHAHMKTYQLAASDERRLLSFQVESINVGASRVVDGDRDRQPPCPRIEVQAARLDDVLRPNAPLRLVKIDVEGHELQVIRGMSGLLATHGPCVVFEQQAVDFVDGSSAVITALRGCGYTRFFTVERTPSSRQGGRLNQVRSNLVALVRGLRMQIVETGHFAPAFYEMIIAVKA